MNFIEKRVSVKRAIGILSRNGIKVDENEAATILDFLYLMAKTFNKDNDQKNHHLNEKSNNEKMPPELTPAHLLDFQG